MKSVNTADIRINGGTQSRAAINQEVVSEYAEAIAGGAEFPPIVVFFDGSSYWLADGFHRYRAYAQTNAHEVPADIRQGSQRDAVLYSVGANASHGLRRTNDDKRRAVMVLLNDPEWSKWSDREIARQAGVGNQMVGHLRKSICVNHTDDAPRTVTRSGTTYEQNTANIGSGRSEHPEPACWPKGETAEPVEQITTPSKDEAPKPVDPDAKLRAEYRAMTPEAQEDDWIGLRHEISDLRKRVQKQTSIIADQKQAIHQLSEGSDIGKALSAKMKELGAVKLSRDEALAAVKREEYKRKLAEKELAAITGQEIKFA